MVEGEDSDRVLAQVALVSGITIGPQVTSRTLFLCEALLTSFLGRHEEPVPWNIYLFAAAVVVLVVPVVLVVALVVLVVVVAA